jgi:hypothetical protein
MSRYQRSPSHSFADGVGWTDLVNCLLHLVHPCLTTLFVSLGSLKMTESLAQ